MIWPFKRKPAPPFIADNRPKTINDLEAHVARFEAAIAQCAKPERLPELNRWLAYWQARLTAARLEAGV